MLLSRVAENLYWAARYLERAEGTARVVREHTNLMVDIPTSVAVTWEPLLAITGSRELFDAVHPHADELSIIRFLVADPENHGSVLMSVEQARENLRTTREVLPREVWEAVNDLFLSVVSHHTDGVARRTRSRFLEQVIHAVQQVVGILDGTTSRDDAFDLLTLGRAVERADMTTRVLDVRAGTLVANPATQRYDEVQWMSVLRSLSALQMYHRTTRAHVDGRDALVFLLTDRRFPRSVAFCLHEIEEASRDLPRSDEVLTACADAQAMIAAAPLDELVAGGLHDWIDALQLSLAEVDHAISAAWFRPAAVPLDGALARSGQHQSS